MLSFQMQNIQFLTTLVLLFVDQVQQRDFSAVGMELHQGHRTVALMNHVPLLAGVLMERMSNWTTLRNSTLMELKDKVMSCYIFSDTIGLEFRIIDIANIAIIIPKLILLF